MSNIVEYIKWNSELLFNEKELNIIDNLVLSQLAYSSFVQDESCGADSTVAEFLVRNKEIPEDFNNTYPDFIDAVINSKRFGSLKIASHEDVYSKSVEVQFAACSFILDDDHRFVAFRGTDTKLVGWKEDCMISYKSTEAQSRSVEFLESVVNAEPDKRFYVGGHSKGGNMALYSVCHASDDVLSKVVHVFNNDGPGLCPEVSNISSIERIKDITTQIIPEFSIFGKLWEYKFDDSYIVKSSFDGVMQHDLTSWEVSYGKLELAEQNFPTSEWLAGCIVKWVDTVDEQSRIKLVDDLFSALSSTGAETVTDIPGTDINGIARATKKVLDADEESKKALGDLPMTFLLDDYWTELKKKSQDRANSDNKADGKKKIKRKFGLTRMIQGFALVIAAILLMILPTDVFYNASIIIIMLILFVEIGITIRALYKSKWDFQSEAPRIVLCVALLCLEEVFVFKDGILFIVGTVIVGFMTIICGYSCLVKAKRNINKPYNIVMLCFYLLTGAFAMVCPNAIIQAALIMPGQVFLVDGIVSYFIFKK